MEGYGKEVKKDVPRTEKYSVTVQVITLQLSLFRSLQVRIFYQARML
jgi:hypothetical protein